MLTVRRFAAILPFAVCLFVWSDVQGETPADGRTATTSEEDVARKPFRYREGQKLVDKLGEFRETGGRIAFYPEGSSVSLQLLENLALERVARDLDQRTRKWSVSGLITEYRGVNFLLLHRAVQKARSTRNSGVPRS